MSNSIVLYALVVLIWGSTWLAIKYQLGLVAPELSVAYRFAIATAILLVIQRFKKERLKRTIHQHIWMALQGFTLFSINYILVYIAEGYLTSGVVSVVFSAFVVMNVINSAIWFGEKIRIRVVVGALLGLTGIGVVFFDELTKVHFTHSTIVGILLALLNTFVASLGNMVAVRNQKYGISVTESNGWGMLYGTLLTFAYVLFRGTQFTFDFSLSYILSLLYLAIFGSVIAFGCYLTLVKRIGAARASYSAILFPIVALLLSTAFEAYHWTAISLVGVVLILGGNFVILRR